MRLPCSGEIVRTHSDTHSKTHASNVEGWWVPWIDEANHVMRKKTALSSCLLRRAQGARSRLFPRTVNHWHKTMCRV